MPSRLLVETLLGPWLRPRAPEPFRLPGALAAGRPVLILDAGDTAELAFHAPVLRALSDGCPGAPLDVLASPRHAPLLAAAGFARHCRAWEPRRLRPFTPGFVRLLRSLRREPWQAALLLAQAPAPALELVLRAAGAPLRLGPSHPDAWPAVSLELRHAADDPTYLGDRPAAALRWLGLAPPPGGATWLLPEERARQARQVVRFNKPRPDHLLIACDPSPGKAGAGPSVTALRHVGERLLGRFAGQALPVAAVADEPRLAELRAVLPAPPPALRCGDLLETLLVLAQCDLLVAGNTDLFHWAVALGVPAVGLFTPADGPEWEPGDRPRAGLVRAGEEGRFEFEAVVAAALAAGLRPPSDGVRLASAAGGADTTLPPVPPPGPARAG